MVQYIVSKITRFFGAVFTQVKALKKSGKVTHLPGDSAAVTFLGMVKTKKNASCRKIRGQIGRGHIHRGCCKVSWVEAGQTIGIFEVNQNGFLFSDPQKNRWLRAKKAAR